MIYSCFPGTGKTHHANQHGVHDSDSSEFSWVSKGVRHPKWPSNYIDHLWGLSGTIFVSSHKEVRDALSVAGMEFSVIYPSSSLKDEYLQRYRDRGSPKSFVSLLSEYWEEWVVDMSKENRCVKAVELKCGQFVSDVLLGVI